MTSVPFFRRLWISLVPAALACALTLPAFALFGLDKTVTDASLPTAEPFSLTTYRDVAVCGTLSGVSPQGGSLTFRITKKPARGAVTLSAENTARFTYTPYEGKTGRDSFSYVAVDEAGQSSLPAKVSVQIKKQKTGVVYADMAGNEAHKAAVVLAEEGIFTGERLGEAWFFRPETVVSREEFLAMAMDAVKPGVLEAGDTAASTGFSDEASIAVWARPYVASALGAGMVRGTGETADGPVFTPSRAISQPEAVVLISRLLGLDNRTSQGEVTPESAPAWAYQAAVNLAVVGVLTPEEDGFLPLESTLTRDQAAQMLLAARETLGL